MASHYIRAQFYTCTCTCACAYAHAYAHVVHAHVHVHVHVQVQVQVQVQGTRDAKAEFLNYVKAKGVCPVSALTQLCPHSSAPFFIVKGLYLGQVFSQVSAVVCLWLKLVGQRRGDNTGSSSPAAFRHSGRTSSHRESTARAFIHSSPHHLEQQRCIALSSAV